MERRKLYRTLSDKEADKHGQIRVVDESGEGYLYPRSFFEPISLPLPIRKAVFAAA